MAFQLPKQCSAIARSGKRCGITEESKAKTSDGNLACDSLRKGCRQCIFHLELFVTERSRPVCPLVVYIDFETTSLSVIEGHICEFGVLCHRCSAAYSTVVKPPNLPTVGVAVHGITDEELAQGPSP